MQCSTFIWFTFYLLSSISHNLQRDSELSLNQVIAIWTFLVKNGPQLVGMFATTRSKEISIDGNHSLKKKNVVAY